MRGTKLSLTQLGERKPKSKSDLQFVVERKPEQKSIGIEFDQLEKTNHYPIVKPTNTIIMIVLFTQGLEGLVGRIKKYEKDTC